MLIRELGAADADAFQSLRLAALRDRPSAFASSYEEERETPIDDVAARLIGTADSCVLGAWVNSNLIGMLGLQRERMRKLSHKAFVWGMYVASNARRQGTGSQLLARAITRAAAMPGVLQINLGVNAANAEAIALYQRAGFTSFGIERGFMLLDGELHDEIHMVGILENITTAI